MTWVLSEYFVRAHRHKPFEENIGFGLIYTSFVCKLDMAETGVEIAKEDG